MTSSGSAAAPPEFTAARIDERLVRRLLAEQFPQWADLPLRVVVDGGNDHRMFRLGDELSVRLPSAAGYVPQVDKEQAWLRRLAPQLPLPIPDVRGMGRASAYFPAPWSVYGWINGRRPSPGEIRDNDRFAADLAGFLVALRSADTAGAPEPGLHSAYRGGPLEHWDLEMRDLVQRISGPERDRAVGLWRDALDASFTGAPVWVHGDITIANLLVNATPRLSAVVDFGCSAVGDPACDTIIRWTQFHGSARRAFVRKLRVDDATWARGRGWALWKALIMITNKPPEQAESARYVLDQLFAEA